MSDLLTSTVHFCTCRSKSRATSIATTFHQSPPSPTESTITSTDVSNLLLLFIKKHII
jgi:hypothetical protein